MPKQLHEISRFNTGIALNSDERDIEEESASYSLNINPVTKDGILDSIQNDRFIMSATGIFTKAVLPCIHGSNTQISDSNASKDPCLIDNFEALTSRLGSSVSFI